MPDIISYAQYGEDLVLLGALAHVSKGFYIDVGAADPIFESVTKLFYDCGWSGINMEPRPSGFAALVVQRPRDINLQIAGSNRVGTILLHQIEDQVGLSTSVDEYADEYVAKGMRCQSYLVPSRPLADVCAEYAPPDIHFLKVDVEGAERSVLEGCDFKRFRPWLLAIEATIPFTYTPSHEEWEHIVLDAGYEFALFHQINRYYVAREHIDLKDRIQAPIIHEISS